MQQGETAAFQLLVEKYQHLAYTVAYNIVHNNEEAEEIVQDVFVKVYRNIHQHNKESKFSSWLYKIVYNTSLTRLRKKKLATESLDDKDYDIEYGFEDVTAWGDLLNEERKVFIGKALESLKEEDNLILTLYYLAEKSMQEIGEITGWQRSAAKVRLHRARAKLYLSLDELLKDEKRALL